MSTGKYRTESAHDEAAQQKRQEDLNNIITTEDMQISIIEVVAMFGLQWFLIYSQADKELALEHLSNYLENEYYELLDTEMIADDPKWITAKDYLQDIIPLSRNKYEVLQRFIDGELYVLCANKLRGIKLPPENSKHLREAIDVFFTEIAKI
jgi:hypothetical protein